jgi:hypothetical protein
MSRSACLASDAQHLCSTQEALSPIALLSCRVVVALGWRHFIGPILLSNIVCEQRITALERLFLVEESTDETSQASAPFSVE